MITVTLCIYWNTNSGVFNVCFLEKATLPSFLSQNEFGGMTFRLYMYLRYLINIFSIFNTSDQATSNQDILNYLNIFNTSDQATSNQDILNYLNIFNTSDQATPNQDILNYLNK